MLTHHHRSISFKDSFMVNVIVSCLCQTLTIWSPEVIALIAGLGHHRAPRITALGCVKRSHTGSVLCLMPPFQMQFKTNVRTRVCTVVVTISTFSLFPPLDETDLRPATDRLNLPINFDRTPDEKVFKACLNAYVQQVLLRLRNDVAATPEEQRERVRAFEFAAIGIADHGKDVATQQADIRAKAKAAQDAKTKVQSKQSHGAGGASDNKRRLVDVDPQERDHGIAMSGLMAAAKEDSAVARAVQENNHEFDHDRSDDEDSWE
jgi:hypothetical protein